MTDTHPIHTVAADRTDTAAQPIIPTARSIRFQEHVALRPLTRARHRRTITAEELTGSTATAALAAVILLVAFGVRGFIAYLVVAVLAVALAIRMVLAVRSSMAKLDAIDEAAKRR